MSALSESILDYRAKRKLTASVFAKRAGVSERTLRRVMRGGGNELTKRKIELSMKGE